MEIGYYAMNDNYILKSLFIPASVEIIQQCGISGLRACTSFVFEAGSRLKTVGPGAWDFIQAEELILPSSITSFGDGCFALWQKLKRLYICFDLVLNNSTKLFDGCPSDLKIYVRYTYQGEYFGGKKVIKVESCGVLSCKCTNRSSAHSVSDAWLCLTTSILS